jgi:hypothetical protein
VVLALKVGARVPALSESALRLLLVEGVRVRE